MNAEKGKGGRQGVGSASRLRIGRGQGACPAREWTWYAEYCEGVGYWELYCPANRRIGHMYLHSVAPASSPLRFIWNF